MPGKSRLKKRKAQPSPKKPNNSLGKVGGTDLLEKNMRAVKNPVEVSPAKKKTAQERNYEPTDMGGSQIPPNTGTSAIGSLFEQKTPPTPQHTGSRSLNSTEDGMDILVAPVVGEEAGPQSKLVDKVYNGKKGKRGEGRKREEEDNSEGEINKKNKKDNDKEEEDDLEVWQEREGFERGGGGIGGCRGIDERS